MNRFAMRPTAAATLALAALVLLGGCAGTGANAPPTTRGSAQPGQRVFATPEDAAGVLKDAVATKDRNLLIEIYGREGVQLVLSGDPVQENNRFERFAKHLNEQLRVDRPAPDRAVLYVGAENWPFPIPVVRGAGGWYFDTEAGKDELLNRRIGRNELGAIAVCRAYVVAQQEYARVDRDGSGVTHYALRFRSSEGKRDGLYWPAADNEPVSPMGPLVAQATMEGYDPLQNEGEPKAYRGYMFHLLTAQGDAATGGKMSYVDKGQLVKGFALIAWPAEWGTSGVMTFMVNQEGRVYEKNLGPGTADLAKSVTEFNPGDGWEPVND